MQWKGCSPYEASWELVVVVVLGLRVLKVSRKGALGPKGETGPHISDKKIDIDSLLPQTLKSRFFIPDYDNSDNNEMWLTGNMFTVKLLLKTYQKVLIYKGIRWLM